MPDRSTTLITAAALALLALAACDGDREQVAAGAGNRSVARAEPANEPKQAAEKSISVMRPAVQAEVEPPPAPEPEPLDTEIPFAFGEVEVAEANQPALDRIAQAAAASEGAITIRGHTDSRGNDEANRRISGERAEAVRDYLVGKGVAPERLTTVALGETRPVAPNANLDGSDDEAGRQRNRRVVVVMPEANSQAASAPAAEASGT